MCVCCPPIVQCGFPRHRLRGARCLQRLAQRNYRYHGGSPKMFQRARCLPSSVARSGVKAPYHAYGGTCLREEGGRGGSHLDGCEAAWVTPWTEQTRMRAGGRMDNESGGRQWFSSPPPLDNCIFGGRRRWTRRSERTQLARGRQHPRWRASVRALMDRRRGARLSVLASPGLGIRWRSGLRSVDLSRVDQRRETLGRADLVEDRLGCR